MMSRRSFLIPRRYIIIAIAATVLLATLTILNATNLLYTWRKHAERRYSYVAEDWPEFWSLRQSREVLMVFEETEHFAISGIDATEEWAATSPDGFGFVRLGPEQRGFGLSMTHEQHCLRLIRSTLSGNQDPIAQSHIQYCLNYIRQMVLCSPDLTLEPADILERELDTERVYATHVCKDWRVIYDRLSDSWKNWIKSTEDA